MMETNKNERLWYDTEGQRTMTEADLREEYENLPSDQRALMTFEEYIRAGEEETLRRISSEIEEESSDIDDKVIEDALWGLLTGEWDTEDCALEGCRVRTYENAGVMTYNRGLVVSLPDGSEFQITIVQSR